jgi:hypothetical protein
VLSRRATNSFQIFALSLLSFRTADRRATTLACTLTHARAATTRCVAATPTTLACSSTPLDRDVPIGGPTAVESEYFLLMYLHYLGLYLI